MNTQGTNSKVRWERASGSRSLGKYAPLLLPFLMCLLPLISPTPQHWAWGVTGVLWGIWVLSLNIVWGYAGQMSFAQFGLGAVGAYTFAILAVQRDWSPLLAVIVAVALTCVASLILSIAALRLRDFYFAILTVSFSLIILSVLAGWELAGRTAGLLVPQSLLPTFHIFGIEWNTGSREGGFYLLVALIFMLANTAAIYMARSAGGSAMHAVRDDEQLCRSLGINTLHVKTVAFVLSAFVAACAGILQVLSYNLAVPELFNLDQMLVAVMLLVLAGRGSIYAATLSALIYVVLYEVIPIDGIYRGGLLGVVVIMMVLFVPSGFLGLVGRLRRSDDRDGAKTSAADGLTEESESEGLPVAAGLDGGPSQSEEEAKK